MLLFYKKDNEVSSLYIKVFFIKDFLFMGILICFTDHLGIIGKYKIKYIHDSLMCINKDLFDQYTVDSETFFFLNENFFSIIDSKEKIIDIASYIGRFCKNNETYTFEINSLLSGIKLPLKKINRLLIKYCIDTDLSTIKVFTNYNINIDINLTISHICRKILDINKKVIDTKILNKTLNQYLLRNKTNIFDYLI